MYVRMHLCIYEYIYVQYVCLLVGSLVYMRAISRYGIYYMYVMLCSYACTQVGMYALKTAYKMLQLSIASLNICKCYIYVYILQNVLQNVSMDAIANPSQNVSAWLANCCQWWLANSNLIYSKLQKSVAFLLTSSCCFLETITTSGASCLKKGVFHNKPLSATWRMPETSWPLHLPNAEPSPGPRRIIHHTDSLVMFGIALDFRWFHRSSHVHTSSPMVHPFRSVNVNDVINMM